MADLHYVTGFDRNGVELLPEQLPEPLHDQDLCEKCNLCVACFGGKACHKGHSSRHWWKVEPSSRIKPRSAPLWE